MTDEPTFREGMEMLAPLMQASLGHTFDVTNRVIDFQRREAAEWRARYELAMENLDALRLRPWMPTWDTIIDAACPSSASVAERAAEYLREGE